MICDPSSTQPASHAFLHPCFSVVQEEGEGAEGGEAAEEKEKEEEKEEKEPQEEEAAKGRTGV